MIFIFYLFFGAINYLAINYFIGLAKRTNIVALGNNKNLHEGVIPRGAGIVFGNLYVILITISYLHNLVSFNLFLPILFGSLFCLLLGFLDDIYDLKVRVKFFSQFIIILPIVFYICFYTTIEKALIRDLLKIMVFTFFIVWMLNAFNFLDGADGHLSCVAILQCILMMIGVYMNSEIELIIPLLLLLSVVLIFLIFNWPPAKVFMGDAGSLFIGVNFIIFILISLQNSFLNPYLIIIIFSYFFIDTFGTLVIRTFLKKPWRLKHRSHPYQNFTRIFNHKKMLNNVIIFHVTWLLPITIFASLYPYYQFYLTILSIVPPFIFLIKFGPIFSSD